MMEVQSKGRKDQWKDGSTVKGKEGSMEGWKFSQREGRIKGRMELQSKGRKDQWKALTPSPNPPPRA